MKNKNRWIIISLMVIIVAFLVWYFSAIVTYVLVAAVLSLIGQPLVKTLNKIKIGKFHFPNTLSAIITLLVIICTVVALISIFVPIIANQATAISNIDPKTFTEYFKEPLASMHSFLVDYNLISANESIESSISAKILSYASVSQFSDVFGYIFGFAGNVFWAFFAISFTTFFFLKDEKMFFNIIMLLTPIDYQTEVKHILLELRKMLTRYFIGLCLDLFIVITLITVGMMIIGVKNALIIGFFAGIMNVVPYVGPLIGGALGILLGITGNLSPDFYSEIVPMIIKMLCVFVTVNLLDAMVLQPTIYSSSVKAHPLEIFIVIMAAGSIAGIPGMILAIPSYTVIRIVAKEFFSKFRLVQKLTEGI